MAKKAWTTRNEKKQRTADKYRAKRAELKAAGDYEALSQLPRNASPVRVVNRCTMTARRQGYMRKFGLSRIAFREEALAGMIPGVTKASW
ncbi:MAG: 30S ribosomal protein S14 [Verrucomicrobiales bacterium]|jgi:small subunit ribosomal protein S14|nr:30S ribosomal protein S14 [Verrucomicrobiales bacterium]HCU87123.1 30S ribosomal protein S14 [Verrucomicrobiales bacterium]|tara:strand:- start:85 stop:354 length:270 start_codon:yes stop_codon:yes gene_type:complete